MNRSFPVGALFVILCSFVLGVILTYGFFKASAIARLSEHVPVQTTSTVSAFQAHYVGFDGAFAHIPFKFCLPLLTDGSFTAQCGVETSFVEVDLKEHPLPVTSIRSAVTNGDLVVYETDVGRKGASGCTIPDLFIYNLTAKETRQLKNDPSMWTCGASGSSLHSLSASGRYLSIVSKGVAPGYEWIYDLEKDRLDTDFVNAQRIYFFSPGEDTAREDLYTLFIDGCGNESFGCSDEVMIKVRNNRTRTTVRLSAVEKQLSEKGIPLSTIEEIRYLPGTQELQINGNGIDQKVIVKNFNKQLPE